METPRDRMRAEAAAVLKMTPKQLVTHIWMYYRFHLIVTAAVIAVVISIIGTVTYNRKDVLISGIFINTGSTPEGYSYVSDDYWAFCGSDKNTRVDMIDGRDFRFWEDVLPQSDAATLVMLASMMNGKSLDYLITDERTIHYLEEQEGLLDLSTVLGEDVLGKYETIRTASGITGIRLDGTPFAEKFGLTAEDNWITFAATAPHTDHIASFLDYLFAAQ